MACSRVNEFQLRAVNSSDRPGVLELFRWPTIVRNSKVFMYHQHFFPRLNSKADIGKLAGSGDEIYNVASSAAN